MTGIEIKIEPEQINEMVSQAILASAIGDQVKESITRSLQSYTFKDSVDKAVQSTIAQIIYKLLGEEHGDEIRQAVREKVSTEIVEDLAGKAFDQWLSNRVN